MIVLTDPRQRALEGAVANYVGYRQRKSQQQQDMNDFQSGLNTLKQAKQRRFNPDPSEDDYNQAIAENYGIQNAVGLDGRGAILKYKNDWNDAQKQIVDIDKQLADTGLDEASKNTLLQKKSRLTNQQKMYSGQADLLRGVLTPKNVDLQGLRKEDAGIMPPAAQPNLFNFKVNEPKVSAGSGDLQSRDWLGLKSMMDKALPVPVQNDYLITLDDLAKNDQIKQTASHYAKQRSLQGFNESDYMTDVLQELVNAKISPSVINTLLPYAQQYGAQVNKEKTQNTASSLFSQLQNAQDRTDKAILISQLKSYGYDVPNEILKHDFVMNHIDGGGNVFAFLYDKNTGQTEPFIIPKTIDPTDKYKTDMNHRTSVDTANIRSRGGVGSGRANSSSKYYERPSTNVNEVDQAHALLETIANYPNVDQIKRDLEQYEPFLEKALGTEAAHNDIAYILMEAERRGIPGSYVQSTATDGFLKNR